jgi:hypothetical protein
MRRFAPGCAVFRWLAIGAAMAAALAGSLPARAESAAGLQAPALPLSEPEPLPASLVPLAATSPAASREPAKPPPEYRIDKARVYLSPFTAWTLSAELQRSPQTDLDEELRGVGVSIGADFIFQRYLALWISSAAGSITAVEGHAGKEPIRVRRASGTFYAVEAGAAGVLSEGPFTGLGGIGLAYSSADFTGIAEPFGAEIDSSLTLTGAVLTLRGDYTLRNGFFAGIGLDYGLGVVGGKEASGADSAHGTLLLIYLPLGWTY